MSILFMTSITKDDMGRERSTKKAITDTQLNDFPFEDIEGLAQLHRLMIPSSEIDRLCMHLKDWRSWSGPIGGMECEAPESSTWATRTPTTSFCFLDDEEDSIKDKPLLNSGDEGEGNLGPKQQILKSFMISFLLSS